MEKSELLDLIDAYEAQHDKLMAAITEVANDPELGVEACRIFARLIAAMSR